MHKSTEAREGKALSAAHTGLLAKAHAALAAVLAHADPDDLPDDDAAGDGDVSNLYGANRPDGTQGAPNPDPASAEDGTGSRAAAVAPVIRGGSIPAIRARTQPGRRRVQMTVERRDLTGAIELRSFSTDRLEVRSDAAANQLTVTGYPIVYDTPYSVTDRYGTFRETMARGVASHLLASADTVFLVNHEGLPLARTLAGNLTLRDTPTALGFTATLDLRSPSAMDLAVALERRDVTQMSVGMIVGEDRWDKGQSERLVLRLDDLCDVSAVTWPASPTTSIDIVRQDQILATLAEIRQRRPDGSRSILSTGDENALPDDAFAFIEPGGTKDSEGKTVPRSLRHFPIHDPVHVRNALARIGQGADFSEEAKPAVLAAAKKFGIHVSASSGRSRQTRTTDEVRAELARIRFEAGHREGERLRTRIGTLRAAEGTTGADHDTTTTKSFPALHEPFSGAHVHSHSAYASQGDDATHQHAHIHDGDASHDHDHSLRGYVVAGTKLIGSRQEANRHAAA